MKQGANTSLGTGKLLVLFQDATILPPVPKEYEDRGIVISPTKDGTLQYTCTLSTCLHCFGRFLSHFLGDLSVFFR